MRQIRTQIAAAVLLLGAAIVWAMMASDGGAQTNSSGEPASKKNQPAPAGRTPAADSSQPNFGAQFQRGDNGLGNNGLMVSTVQEDGFFHNAGIHEGDRIISIDGHNVATEDEFRRFVMGGHGRVPLVVTRNG